MERTLTDITWDEHTATAAKWYSNMNMKERTNILCPKCGQYIYRDLGTVLTTYPPQYRYECECGWSEVGY